MILNDRATKDQKIAAASKAAEITAGEVVKKTIKRTVTPARIQQTKDAIKNTIKAAIPFAGTVGVAVAGGYAMSKNQSARINRQAQKMLDDTIRRTPAAQRSQFTPSVKASLLKQYAAWIRKQNEILFTK